MADKSPKFLDIKAPDKSAPSSSSRPLLVTNRSVLGNDPMVNSDPDGSGETKPAEPMARTAKTIKPVSADLIPPDKPEETPAASANESDDDNKLTVSVKSTEASAPEPTDKVDEPEKAEPLPKTPESPSTSGPEDLTSVANRDVAAESQADEAKAAAEAEAVAAREEELENLIASGQYNVPVNAVNRKKSRMVAILLCLIAIFLGVVVIDAALDAGMFDFDAVPHTDLLKDK